MTGGWEYADMKPCDLPQEVATAFSEAFSRLMGTDFIPVLYVGSQVVNGMNYCIVCKTKMVVPNGADGCKVVILYAPIGQKAVVTDIYDVIR